MGRTSDVEVPVFDQGGGEYSDELYHLQPLPENEYVESLDLVDQAAVDRYHEQGFLAVRSAMPGSSVDEALTALRDAARPDSGAQVQYEASAQQRLDAMSELERLAAIRKVVGFVEHSSVLSSIATDPILISKVEAMLGETSRLYLDQAFHKPPGGREKPWHQDQLSGIRVPSGVPIVSAWIALDEATLENGCMCVIRRSHSLGPRRHVRGRDVQICDEEVSLADGVAVPLRPGGLLFFDGLVHHGTAANRSTRTRRSVQFHYTRASAEDLSLEEYQAVFGVDETATC